METEQLYDLFRRCSGVSTDSRRIESGALFFALKGDNFNGNAYAAAALEAGASYAVVDDAEVYRNNCARYGERLVQVENTLVALQQLAKYNRLNFFITWKWCFYRIVNMCYCIANLDVAYIFY